MRDGLYRCVARDGTVAAVQFSDGRLVELIVAGKLEPPARRPRPKRIGDSVVEWSRRMERERELRMFEEMARIRRGA